jgi:hypothetical protein
MKITLLAATLSLTVAAATARADVNLVDNDQKVTVDCAKDKAVNIAGNKANVTLTGTCEMINISGNEATVKGSALHVQVSGNDNTIALDATDHIMVSGNKNTITYKKAAKAKKTAVMNSGTDNKVSLKK